MYFGITPLSEHSGNDTETRLPKTAIAETPHIDTAHISNAADTAIFCKSLLAGSVNASSQPPQF